MCAAILFVALLAGSSSGLRTQQESKITPDELKLGNANMEAWKAHFIPAMGKVCFEGEDAISITGAVSAFRAGPLASFSPHSGVVENTTCKQAGFPKLIAKNESCWQNKAMYTKDELDVDQVLTELRTGNLAEINAFADRRGISRELAMAWTTCVGGCEGGAATGFRWWGADRQYSEAECKMHHAFITPTMRRVGTVGSFVADSNLMCWEGPFAYMKTILKDTQRTPGPNYLFKNATVQKKTCLEMGFDEPRDLRDECWPEATKVARSNGGFGIDMLMFVTGPSSYYMGMPANDKAQGFPNGTSTDLASCNCHKGGANRDRGMLYTTYAENDPKYDEIMAGKRAPNPNGNYITRYSDKFCQDLLNKYRK
jgi:ribosomal protein L37E